MPKVTKTRIISASPGKVWGLISDPYSLPRWWPRATRVEDVDGDGEGAQWTKVLETADGRGVRADYRCATFEPQSRYAWEQLLSDTPFERHLRAAGVEVSVRPQDTGTAVELTATQSLRGLSRLGAPMMRRAQGGTVETALDGIETALAAREGDPG